jgi:preprotein translocase subunit SecA
MALLLHTTNSVRLSFVQALLRDAGIHVEVFDANISALEAGIGAFPRRLMVDQALWLAAKTILIDAGEFYDD